MIITVKDGVAVEHKHGRAPRLRLKVSTIEITMPFAEEERDALIRALMGPPKYGIMHASYRPLGLRDQREVWSSDNVQLVLFETVAEAEAHIEKRIAQHPSSDWRFATVQMHTPGVRLHSDWSEIPERRSAMNEADIIVGRRYGGRIVLRVNRYEDRWEMSEAEFEALKAKHPGARVVDLTLKETL